MTADTSIVELLRTDREAGAKRLVAEYRERLLAAALSLGCDESAAEDLVFRTIERAVEKIGTCRTPEAFFEWLYAILLNYRRKDLRPLAAKNTVFTDDLPEPEAADAREAVSRGIDGEVLRAAVAALPSEMREAIVMRYFMDIPVSRMAKILTIPEGTVKSRLHYARLCLSGILETKGGKAAFRVLVALLVALAALFGYRATRPDLPDDWLGGELVRVAEGRRLGAVASVSTSVYLRAGKLVSRQLEPEIENDGAVLMANCAFEASGIEASATIQLLQIGDDIYGRVLSPSIGDRAVRLVTHLPARDGDLSVGGLRFTFRDDAPEAWLRASFVAVRREKEVTP